MEGDKLVIPGLKRPAVVHDAGLLITANDGVKVGTIMSTNKNAFKSKVAQRFGLWTLSRSRVRFRNDYTLHGHGSTEICNL